MTKSAVPFAALALLVAMGGTTSLRPGQSYRVTVYAVGSTGAISEYSHVGAVAGSDGTVSFSAPAPSRSDSNFVVVTLTDSSGAVLRRSIGAAAPPGRVAAVGVTGVTTAQSEGILAAFRDSGSDDPLLAVLGCAIFRSASLSADDIAVLSGVLRSAAAWFNGSLPQDRLVAWRSSLTDNPGVDLADLFAEMKAAVDNGSEAAAAVAGGRAADLLADAAHAAGIPLDLLLAAGDVALGEAASGLQSALLAETLRQSVGQSLSLFRFRLGALKSLLEYADAMDILVIPDDEQADFRGLLASTRSSLDAVEADFAPYHQVPGAADVGPGYRSRIRQIFETSTVLNRASNASVTWLTDSYVLTLGIPLPSFALRDATIPGLSVFRWFETMLRSGQEFSYRRTARFPTVPLTTFDTGNASLDAFLGLHEDVRILQSENLPILEREAEMTRIVRSMRFSNGLYPGPYADAPERAVVTLLLQPSMD